jgi:ubiquinone/menaquinone biosynthesis C-methylase UbiE
MKGRESGMPAEDAWDAFFDADTAVERIFDAARMNGGDAVEFGCGYGTFTIPAAARMSGTLAALDIDPEMVRMVEDKAHCLSLANIRAELRDFVSAGTGLPDASQSHAMIFNLLHIESPLGLIKEARRVLKPGGALSVIHWRSDIPTPRGPSLDIRPSPKQCRAWIEASDFTCVKTVDVTDAAPFHFALVAR